MQTDAMAETVFFVHSVDVPARTVLFFTTYVRRQNGRLCLVEPRLSRYGRHTCLTGKTVYVGMSTVPNRVTP
jgi:hypothetical protein